MRWGGPLCDQLARTRSGHPCWWPAGRLSPSSALDGRSNGAVCITRGFHGWRGIVSTNTPGWVVRGKRAGPAMTFQLEVSRSAPGGSSHRGPGPFTRAFHESATGPRRAARPQPSASSGPHARPSAGTRSARVCSCAQPYADASQTQWAGLTVEPVVATKLPSQRAGSLDRDRMHGNAALDRVGASLRKVPSVLAPATRAPGV